MTASIPKYPQRTPPRRNDFESLEAFVDGLREWIRISSDEHSKALREVSRETPFRKRSIKTIISAGPGNPIPAFNHGVGGIPGTYTVVYQSGPGHLYAGGGGSLGDHSTATLKSTALKGTIFKVAFDQERSDAQRFAGGAFMGGGGYPPGDAGGGGGGGGDTPPPPPDDGGDVPGSDEENFYVHGGAFNYPWDPVVMASIWGDKVPPSIMHPWKRCCTRMAGAPFGWPILDDDSLIPPEYLPGGGGGSPYVLLAPTLITESTITPTVDIATLTLTGPTGTGVSDLTQWWDEPSGNKLAWMDYLGKLHAVDLYSGAVSVNAVISAVNTHITDGTKHFLVGDIHHTAIQDIGTNDHAAIDTHIGTSNIHFTEGSIDHGSISGLGDDDHTDYVLKSGLREWDEQAGDPSTPAANKWNLYFKAGGLYYQDDAAAVIGPLGSGGGGAYVALAPTAIAESTITPTSDIAALTVTGYLTGSTAHLQDWMDFLAGTVKAYMTHGGGLYVQSMHMIPTSPGALDMNSGTIINLGTPTNDTDAATRAYSLDKVRESGGTIMTMGAVSDGQLLKRSGAGIIGFTSPVPVLSNGDIPFGNTATNAWLVDPDEMHWDNSLKSLYIGTDDESGFVVSGVTYYPKVGVHLDGAGHIAGISGRRFGDYAGIGVTHVATRSRGTEASQSVVQDADSILSLYAAGHDGTDYHMAVALIAKVDGTPGNNDMPGRLEVHTNPGTTTTSLAATFDKDGNFTSEGDVAGANITATPTAASIPVSEAADTYLAEAWSMRPRRICLRSTSDVDISTVAADQTWETEVVKDSLFTHAANSAEVTIGKSGWFRFMVGITTYCSSGTDRSGSRFYLMEDTGGGYAVVAGTYRSMYNRDATTGWNSAQLVFDVEVTSGYKYKVQAVRYDGTSTVETDGSECNLIIEELRGADE